MLTWLGHCVSLNVQIQAFQGVNQMPRYCRGTNQLVVSLFVMVACYACVEKEFDPNDPKKSFGIAKEPFDDGHYDEAIRKLGEFKSRFPYSQFASEAELLIADSHYQLEHYQESAAAYDTFVKLHPKHPRADYATYRIAESYWEDAPTAESREQEYTEKAVKQWEEVIENYPATPFATKSKDMISQGRRRLAESVRFVARFYCVQEVWHACAYRYTQLLEKFPEQKDIANEALERAAFALDRVADAKEKDPASDKNLYHRSMNPQQIREKAANLRRLMQG
jgi:outer membrane protein assembly factor BamD